VSFVVDVQTEKRPDQLGLVCMYTQNHFPANGACAKPTAEGLGLTPAKLLPDVQEYFREIAFRLYEHNFPVKVFRSLEEPQEDTGTVLLEALGMALGALEAKVGDNTDSLVWWLCFVYYIRTLSGAMLVASAAEDTHGVRGQPDSG
jgi:hypothetical protein